MDIGFNIAESVNENTVRFGIGELKDISSLTVQKQLVQIEKFLQRLCKEQNLLREKIKQYTKLSISSVAAEAKVPRSQINLNQNTLKLYIENRIVEIKKMDNLSIKKHERLKRDKHELEKHLDGLRQQIVDSFEVKLRLEILEVENKRLILLNESKQSDIQKLEKENSKLRKALSEYNKNKIIPFN